MEIYRTEQFFKNEDILNDFLNNILYTDINESSKQDKKSKFEVWKKIKADLNLNISIIGVFGMGITLFFPIVESLMKGMPIEITQETVVMATIASFTIILLESKKGKELEQLKRDSKSLLTELKLRGVGNGIIKKIIQFINLIKDLFATIYKYSGKVIYDITDMFIYTSLFLPLLNALAFVLGKYEMTLDTAIENFKGIMYGIGTISVKHILVDIINKIKNKVKINKKEILTDLDPDNIAKFGDDLTGMEFDEESNQMIKED